MREGTMRTLSRADEVRQRRQERTQQKVSRASKRAIHAAVVPAVVTRGGTGTPIVKRATSRPRKRMVIPLGSPGAEMHMPAIPVIRIGWRLLSALIVINMSGLIYLMLKAPFLMIGSPQVNGVQRVSAADIQAVAVAAGTPIVKFDPAAARYNVEAAFPELKTVDIRLDIPARVVVDVSERQPVIEWQHGDGKTWIDDEGVLFTPRGEAGGLLSIQSNTTPPVQRPIEPEEALLFGTGKNASTLQEPLRERLDGELMQTIMHLASIMPQGTVLYYSGEQGLGWFAPEGWQVYVGTWLDNLDTKVEVYEAIVEHLNQQGISPAMISVAQVNAPFYRMEQ